MNEVTSEKNSGVKLGVYTYNGKDYQFSFNTDVMSKKVLFINGVTSIIVSEDYNSILLDLIFDFELIDIFTDVNTQWVKDESNGEMIDNIEEFLNETKIVDIIKANMGDENLKKLRDAVELNIEYKTGIHRNVVNESISTLIDIVSKKFEEYDMKDVVEFAKNMNNMNNNFTPDSILDAYSKTDMFKSRLNDINKK